MFKLIEGGSNIVEGMCKLVEGASNKLIEGRSSSKDPRTLSSVKEASSAGVSKSSSSSKVATKSTTVKKKAPLFQTTAQFANSSSRRRKNLTGISKSEMMPYSKFRVWITRVAILGLLSSVHPTTNANKFSKLIELEGGLYEVCFHWGRSGNQG